MIRPTALCLHTPYRSDPPGALFIPACLRRISRTEHARLLSLCEASADRHGPPERDPAGGVTLGVSQHVRHRGLGYPGQVGRPDAFRSKRAWVGGFDRAPGCRIMAMLRSGAPIGQRWAPAVSFGRSSVAHHGPPGGGRAVLLRRASIALLEPIVRWRKALASYPESNSARWSASGVAGRGRTG